MNYPVHEDERGYFQELAHASDVKFGQLSILRINAERSRGSHYHTHKEEWFCCIRGRCLMEITNIKDLSTRNIVLADFKKEFVLIKPYESHTVSNVSNEPCELLVIASEEYNEKAPDTFKDRKY